MGTSPRDNFATDSDIPNSAMVQVHKLNNKEFPLMKGKSVLPLHTVSSLEEWQTMCDKYAVLTESEKTSMWKRARALRS
jgi:hypothetical protein